MENLTPSIRFASFPKLVCVGTAFALGLAGCSSVAPSNTTKGAGTGAVIGGLGGAVIGNNSSMGAGTGAAGGAVLGALTGGIIGMVQDARDRKEQDRLAQERAYQQELARKRAEEAKLRAAQDEELAIAQGFRISDVELNDAKKTLEERQEVLKKLQAERQAALQRKKDLDEAREKTTQTEAQIAQLEEELARLKGEEVKIPEGDGNNAVAQKKPDNDSAPPPSAAVKPGS